MGIHDRDYARVDPRAGAGMRRGPTIIGWIVIINVAVFALDQVLPQIQVPLMRVVSSLADQSRPMTVDRKSVPQPVFEPDGKPTSMLAHPIIGYVPGDPRTTIVGQERFIPMPLLQGIGHFSTLKAFMHLEIWRFITYQFLHANTSHILFNMIGLLVFGPRVLEHLGSGRMFLAFYLTCGIFGAFFYLILNMLGWQFGSLPGLLITDPWVPLVGASAAIFGVLMASAKVAKDDMIVVLFVLPMKTWLAAYLFFAIAAANLFILRGQNVGGDAAHIGGALAGFFLIRNPHLLLDFFDDFLRSPRARGNGRARGGDKIDHILAKVAENGMGSLTRRERRTLERASAQRRGGA